MNNKSTAKASFQFKGYRILETSARFPEKDEPTSISIQFAPDGTWDKENKRFVLHLEVRVANDENTLSIVFKINADFIYKGDDEEKVRRFLGQNAPALVFPYIRAYVTNLTALSGIPPLVLPTLNLAQVGRDLLKRLEGDKI